MHKKLHNIVGEKIFSPKKLATKSLMVLSLILFFCGCERRKVDYDSSGRHSANARLVRSLQKEAADSAIAEISELMYRQPQPRRGDLLLKILEREKLRQGLQLAERALRQGDLLLCREVLINLRLEVGPVPEVVEMSRKIEALRVLQSASQKLPAVDYARANAALGELDFYLTELRESEFFINWEKINREKAFTMRRNEHFSAWRQRLDFLDRSILQNPELTSVILADLLVAYDPELNSPNWGSTRYWQSKQLYGARFEQLKSVLSAFYPVQASGRQMGFSGKVNQYIQAVRAKDYDRAFAEYVRLYNISNNQLHPIYGELFFAILPKGIRELSEVDTPLPGAIFKLLKFSNGGEER